MHRPTPHGAELAPNGNSATSGSIPSTDEARPNRTAPYLYVAGAVGLGVVTVVINSLPWRGMPYERPPIVVNLTLVVAAAMCVVLAALCWIGTEVMRRFDRLDTRVTRLEARIEEMPAAIAPAAEDTVRMQQPSMLHSGGRVYFGGLARSQVEALAESVLKAVTAKLDPRLDAVDARVDALDTLIGVGEELQAAAGAENTPTQIRQWIPRELRGRTQ